jgi:hypothetical protein
MPGFLESTISQGYGYLEQTGYVGMATPYVEKVRNTVPLADRAAKKAEEIVPPLLKKADELTEPTIVKMRPYVEPRIEQVKPYVNKTVETVSPYVNKGVETYGQIKDYTEAKGTQIKEFTDAKVTLVKDFTDAKATQIKNLTDPPVKKIQKQGEKLLRVAGCSDLQDLKYETVMGKIASGLSKAEALLDKYLPVPLERSDTGSDTSTESDSSCAKINRSVHAIKNHLFCALMIKIKFFLSLPMVLKASYADGSLKEKVVSVYTDAKGKVISKVEYVKAEAKCCIASLKKKPVLEHLKEKLALIPVKLAPTVTKVAKNPHFIKAVQITVTSAEKILGKEKTVAIVKKIESCIPSVWMAGPKEPITKKAK